MTTVALLGYVTYLLVAFGGRAWLLQRRTGTTGWRGITGRPGSASWWGGVLFAVALVLGLMAPVADLAGLDRLVDGPAVRAAGLALFVIGAVGSLLAQAAMGAAWRVGVDAEERTALVAAGPFALARNPFFTALLVAALGLAVAVLNAVAVVALLALVVAVELQVRVVEEPYLRRVHGQAYLSYAAQVGRFLPGVGRLSARGDR
jgi:protein-S-isoprenylcysteine O-methyltransferase Ste14